MLQPLNINVCCELQDLAGYERACEMLTSLEPNNPHAAYALAGSRYVNLHLVLALEAFQDAVSRFPNHEKANDARKTIAELEPKVDEVLASKNLTRAD